MGLKIEADWVCSHHLKEKGWVRFDFIFSCGFQVEVLKHLFIFPNLWYAPPPLAGQGSMKTYEFLWQNGPSRGNENWKCRLTMGKNFNKNLVWSFVCFQLYSTLSPFLFLRGRINLDLLLQNLTGHSLCPLSPPPHLSFPLFSTVSCSPGWPQTLYVSDTNLELLILSFSGITSLYHHVQFMWCWRARPGTHACWVRMLLNTPLWWLCLCPSPALASSPSCCFETESYVTQGGLQVALQLTLALISCFSQPILPGTGITDMRVTMPGSPVYSAVEWDWRMQVPVWLDMSSCMFRCSPWWVLGVGGIEDPGND